MARSVAALAKKQRIAALTRFLSKTPTESIVGQKRKIEGGKIAPRWPSWVARRCLFRTGLPGARSPLGHGSPRRTQVVFPTYSATVPKKNPAGGDVAP